MLLPPPTQPLAAAAPRRAGPLAVLALLVGGAGVALAGWGVWQVQGLQSRELQQRGRLEAIQTSSEALKNRADGLSNTLAGLPTAQALDERQRLLATLQGEQQRLSQRLETVLGASRQVWRLAEAEHLLRLASLRLSALQDIGSARALVQGADEILQAEDDPAAFAAREQLAKALQALRSVAQPDRTGLFLQLGALREQVRQLNSLNPTFVASDDTAPLASDGRWTAWWKQLSRFVRIDFDAEQDIRPLLAGQSLTQVRLALSLALEQAQWAALNGEAAVFRQALAQAHDILAAHFSQDNPQRKLLETRLNELGELPVAVVTPDLGPALSALQAYLAQRQSAVSAAQAEGQPQPDDAELEGALP
ncbi:MAG: uroporphyrinogen-III C-methyltransferase [Pseudomonas sp.]|uniref:uroporphyrinogen-III C-methyltransferase n=1 Tax=Pseudomonas sp. TaxID=306 RepID=UPI0033957DDD